MHAHTHPSTHTHTHTYVRAHACVHTSMHTQFPPHLSLSLRTRIMEHSWRPKDFLVNFWSLCLIKKKDNSNNNNNNNSSYIKRIATTAGKKKSLKHHIVISKFLCSNSIITINTTSDNNTVTMMASLKNVGWKWVLVSTNQVLKTLYYTSYRFTSLSVQINFLVPCTFILASIHCRIITYQCSTYTYIQQKCFKRQKNHCTFFSFLKYKNTPFLLVLL